MIRFIFTMMLLVSNSRPNQLNSSTHNKITEETEHSLQDIDSDQLDSKNVNEHKNYPRDRSSDGMENLNKYEKYKNSLDTVPQEHSSLSGNAAAELSKDEDSTPVLEEKYNFGEAEKYIEGQEKEQNRKVDQVDGPEHKSSEVPPIKGDEEIKHNPDGEDVKRQRILPLLYTFGTLFNSFLAEFGEVTSSQEIGYNSSEKDNKNSSVQGATLNDTHPSLNGSDSGKKTRFQCALRNVTENTVFEVKIVNSSELLEILNFSKNQKLSPCVLVMFYAPWCYFCASTAPYFNALARAFPQLNILAVDTSHFSYLNARFGTVAVPNVMLFHSRSAVRFNRTTRDLDHFIQFVTNNTGLEANTSVKVEPWDFEGPLSSEVVQKRDWLLWLAWTFVVVCSTYGFIRSLYGQAFIARVRVLWQEHQHIE